MGVRDVDPHKLLSSPGKSGHWRSEWGAAPSLRPRPLPRTPGVALVPDCLQTSSLLSSNPPRAGPGRVSGKPKPASVLTGARGWHQGGAPHKQQGSLGPEEGATHWLGAGWGGGGWLPFLCVCSRYSTQPSPLCPHCGPPGPTASPAAWTQSPLPGTSGRPRPTQQPRIHSSRLPRWSPAHSRACSLHPPPRKKVW